MNLHLKIIGVILILLALVHFCFPRYFKWKQEFSSVSTINREMMYIHTFFISLMVFLMGLLCLTSATDLLNTSLGKQISLGLGIFWLARLCIQFIGYSSSLWKGKLFETTAHVVFSILWAYFGIIFMLIYFE
jgi:hypothetical protein